jgi:Transcriptional regulator containing an amidase domain and an AraC-type DNA-binding HTH domain
MQKYLIFVGLFEVFSVTSELNNFELLDVFTIAKTAEPISAVNGLSVNPEYNFENVLNIDILIISGGVGIRNQMKDIETQDWINEVHEDSLITASICSSSMIKFKVTRQVF